MKIKNQISNLRAISLCFLLLPLWCSAELLDRGNGFIYDTTRDVTWLADSNYAATELNDARVAEIIAAVGSVNGHPLSSSEFLRLGPDNYSGKMSWWAAKAWAGQLSVYNPSLGVYYQGWRLPAMTQPDTACSNLSGVLRGDSLGYNCSGGEMAGLFYGELGGAASSTTGSLVSSSDPDLLLFPNIQLAYFHLASSVSNCPNLPGSDCSAYFSLFSGFRWGAPKGNMNIAWAVLDGDILLRDSDGDGIIDVEEVAAGINPNAVDTDGDGVDDGDEIAGGTDPTQVDTGINFGLIAHYQFESDATDSTSTFDGSWSGSEQYAAGVSGQAADLDGASFIDTGSFNDLGSDFSIAFWFSMDVHPSNSSPGLFSNSDSGGTGLDVRVNHLNSTGAVHVLSQDAVQNAGTELGSGVVPALNQWYHVAIAYDSTVSEMHIYINGTLQAADSGFLEPLLSSYTGAIGANRNYGRYLDGQIDEFRIYSRAISESEIGDLVAGGPISAFATPNDFDNDGDSDVLLRNTSGQWRRFDMQSGLAVSSGNPLLWTGPFYQFQATGDFDGDGDADVLVRDPASGAWWRFTLESGVVVGGANPVLWSGLFWEFRAASDFDGDGDDDILLRNASGQWRLFLMQDGVAVSSVNPGLWTGSAYDFQAAGDFDGDGDADVLVRNSSTGAWWRFTIQDGVVVGGGNPLLWSGLSWEFRAVADFDGDGDDDVLLRNAAGQWRRFDMQNGVAASSGNPLLWTGPTYTFQMTGDFDGDGDADVLVRDLSSGVWYRFTIQDGVVVGGASPLLWTGLAWEIRAGM